MATIAFSKVLEWDITTQTITTTKDDPIYQGSIGGNYLYVSADITDSQIIFVTFTNVAGAVSSTNSLTYDIESGMYYCEIPDTMTLNVGDLKISLSLKDPVIVDGVTYYNLITTGDVTTQVLSSSAVAVVNPIDQTAEDRLTEAINAQGQYIETVIEEQNAKIEAIIPPTVEVGDTYTIASDEDAKVENVGTDENVILDFYIPKGEVGSVDEATSTTAGIMKLYQTTGENVDGTMSQGAINTELTAIQQSVLNNATAISKANEDIATNASDIQTIEDDLDSLSNDVAGNNEQIIALQNEVDNLNTYRIWNGYGGGSDTIEATASTVQTVCTSYIETYVDRDPQNFDKLLITRTDLPIADTDPTQYDIVGYTYSETSSAWVSTGVETATVAQASSTVSGIMKLYQETGTNTDGTISQAVITTELTDLDTRTTALETKTENITVTDTTISFDGKQLAFANLAVQATEDLYLSADNVLSATIPTTTEIYTLTSTAQTFTYTATSAGTVQTNNSYNFMGKLLLTQWQVTEYEISVAWKVNGTEIASVVRDTSVRGVSSDYVNTPLTNRLTEDVSYEAGATFTLEITGTTNITTVGSIVLETSEDIPVTLERNGAFTVSTSDVIGFDSNGDVATQATINAELRTSIAEKADSSTTYTKTEVDALVAGTTVEVTLSADSWAVISAVGKYGYVIPVTGVTTDTNQDVIHAVSSEYSTFDEYAVGLSAWEAGNIQPYEQTDGFITVLAMGVTPTVEMHATVIIRG